MPSLALTAWFLRKRFLILALLVGAASVSAFGQPVFFTVPKTPYDHQMVRVSVALASRATMQKPSSISSLALNEWMTELRAIPYHYSKYWQTPAEVDDAEATDCKGKALALYAKMRGNGATNLRLVIGKHHIYDTVTHAWLEWENTAGSFVLDPTFNEAPVRTAELDPMIYLPIYAYDGVRKYRVSNAGFIAPTTRVASGVNSQGRLPLINPATPQFASPARPGLSLRGESSTGAQASAQGYGLAGRPSTPMASLANSTSYLAVRTQSQQPSPPMAYSNAPGSERRDQRSEVRRQRLARLKRGTRLTK